MYRDISRWSTWLDATGCFGGTKHTLVTATPDTTSIVYGMQNRAVQGMLDFDYMCKRKKPSVEAMIFPFSGNHYVKFYWGTEEILMPVYTTTKEAVGSFISY